MTGSEYYLQQLKNPKWIAKSRKVRDRDGNKCTVCGSTKNLQVHHTYYVSGFDAWEYPIKDLLTVCKDCHHDYHLHNEVPIKTKAKKQPKILKENERIPVRYYQGKKQKKVKRRIGGIIKEVWR